jgi:hypothetical protein
VRVHETLEEEATDEENHERDTSEDAKLAEAAFGRVHVCH